MRTASPLLPKPFKNSSRPATKSPFRPAPAMRPVTPTRSTPRPARRSSPTPRPRSTAPTPFCACGKPTSDEIAALPAGSIVIGYLDPLTDDATAQALAAKKITAFAMESIPRTTRAQSMDSLSSQATVSGYKAVLIAADESPKFLPMLTTAAGTVRPAKVFVIGAGVAGLQAIATARRLGAIVHGVRRAPGRQGAGRVARREVRRDRPRYRRRRDRRWLRQRADRRAEGQADRTDEQDRDRERHRDHDGRDPGSSGAEADPGERRRSDGARFGDHRPRRRDRRQLRADPGRRNRACTTASR